MSVGVANSAIVRTASGMFPSVVSKKLLTLSSMPDILPLEGTRMDKTWHIRTRITQGRTHHPGLRRTALVAGPGSAGPPAYLSRSAAFASAAWAAASRATGTRNGEQDT